LKNNQKTSTSARRLNTVSLSLSSKNKQMEIRGMRPDATGVISNGLKRALRELSTAASPLQ
jgi:hypothetical protein